MWELSGLYYAYKARYSDGVLFSKRIIKNNK